MYSKRGSKQYNLLMKNNDPKPIRVGQQQERTDDDILDDYLREQKRMEQQNKMERMEQEIIDNHIQQEKQKFISSYMRRNKNQQIAYDFDGNFVVPAKPIKNPALQNNQNGFQGVSVKYNENKLIPEKVKITSTKLNGSDSDSDNYKINKKSITEQIKKNQNVNTYQDIVNNIQLSSGVKMINQNDLQAQDQNLNTNLNTNQMSRQALQNKNIYNDNTNQQSKKMTRQEYQNLVANGQNFVRNDYRFQKPPINNLNKGYQQQQINSSSSTSQLKNNGNQILNSNTDKIQNQQQLTQNSNGYFNYQNSTNRNSFGILEDQLEDQSLQMEENTQKQLQQKQSQKRFSGVKSFQSTQNQDQYQNKTSKNPRKDKKSESKITVANQDKLRLLFE